MKKYIYFIGVLLIICLLSISACKKKTYQVTFVGANEEIIETIEVEKGSEVTPPIAKEVEGYTFISWDNDYQNINSNMIINAIYNINTYKVTFVDNDNTIIKEETVDYNCDATTPTIPFKPGYAFVNWDKAYTNIKEDTIIKAIYQELSYQVTFLNDDDSILKQVTVSKDDPIIAPTAPTKEGFIFGGWNQSFENVTTDLIIKPTFFEEPILDYRKVIVVDNYTTLFINNYSSLDLFDISIVDEDIISLNEYYDITGLKIGKTTINLTLKDHPLVKVEMNIEVISKAPNLYTTRQNLELNGVASFCISNFNELVETSLNDFYFSVKDPNILTLNDDFTITGIALGSTTVEVTSKLNSLIKASYLVNVVDPTNSIVITCNHLDGKLKVGDVMNFSLLGDKNLSDYTIVSSNQTVARIREDQSLVIVSEGIATLAFYETNNVKNRTTFIIDINGIANTDYISYFLDLALTQNGIVEGDNNDTKYGEWYHLNNNAWCAMFVSWCWYFAGLSNNLLVKYCSCSAGREWCEQKGIFNYKNVYKPVTGDIVFFLSSGMSHTGIVLYSDDSYVYTIEGNSSNKVGIWRWSLKDARITGYAHPEYPTFEGIPKSYSWVADIKEDKTYWWQNVTEKQDVL